MTSDIRDHLKRNFQQDMVRKIYDEKNSKYLSDSFDTQKKLGWVKISIHWLQEEKKGLPRIKNKIFK